jgi:hypothetical protein
LSGLARAMKPGEMIGHDMEKRLGGTCQRHMKRQPCEDCMAEGSKVLSKQIGDGLESLKRRKAFYIGAPACFALELAVRQVCEAFGVYQGKRFGGCYIVGSVLERADWRDVDIRMILQDDVFAEHFPDSGDHWENDAKWLLLTTAISEWLSKKSSLPIDFQFQPQSHANERHKGPRSAIGIRIAKNKIPHDPH